MGKHSQASHSKILRVICGHGRGWVFTPNAFQGIGSRNVIDLTLKRLKQAGTIRQLARGLYDYPRRHPVLGLLTPSAQTIAETLAGRDATRLQPAGAYAANLLGLSEQVPMKVVFLTDGASRKIVVAKQTITLKRTTPKNMATVGRTSGLVIQALRHLGQRHVNDSVVCVLRRKLRDNDKRQLLKDLPYAPSWIAEVMRRVAEK